MDVCTFVTLSQKKTTGRIWMKFGREIDYGIHTGKLLSQYYVPVGLLSTYARVKPLSKANIT